MWCFFAPNFLGLNISNILAGSLLLEVLVLLLNLLLAWSLLLEGLLLSSGGLWRVPRLRWTWRPTRCSRGSGEVTRKDFDVAPKGRLLCVSFGLVP